MDKKELQRRAGITEDQITFSKELDQKAVEIAALALHKIKADAVEKGAMHRNPRRAGLEIQYVLEKVIKHLQEYA